MDPCPLRKWYIFGNCLKLIKKIFVYSLFHKTLPESSLQMHWISVRFYEIGGTPHFLIPNHFPVYVCVDWKTVRNLETGCTWVKTPYIFLIFPLRDGGGGLQTSTLRTYIFDLNGFPLISSYYVVQQVKFKGH